MVRAVPAMVVRMTRADSDDAWWNNMSIWTEIFHHERLNKLQRAADKRARIAARLAEIRGRTTVRFFCWLCKEEKSTPKPLTCSDCIDWWNSDSEAKEGIAP
jgi:hypothetical protein